MKTLLKVFLTFIVIFLLFSCEEDYNTLAFEPTEYTDDIAAKQIAIYNAVKDANSKIDLKFIKDKKVKYDINLIFDNDIIEELLNNQFDSLIKENGGVIVFDKEVKEGKETKTIPAEFDYYLDITFLVLGTYKNRTFFYDEIIGKCVFIFKTSNIKGEINKAEYSSKYSFKKNILTNNYTYFVYSVILLIILLVIGIRIKKK